MLLNYQIVPAASPEHSPESHFANADAFRLVRELRSIDGEHNSLLRTLTERDRELVAYLKGINRKIDLIASTVTALHGGVGTQEPQPVSLSETAIAFCAEAPLAVGVTLALEITLLPQLAALAVYGEVVANRDEPPERNIVNFISLRDPDRQVLARHLLQVQIAQRRSGV